MVTNKAIIIQKEIDVARCKGNWRAIPELARRYKKHNPTGIVLEQSILAEAKLNDIISTRRAKESKHKFENDALDSISLATRLEPSLMRPIQQQVAIALGDKDATSETQLYKQMAKIILAQSYFESGEYIKCLETIEEAHYSIKPDQQQQQGYSYTVYMQALSMKAMCYDLLKKEKEAIKEYINMVALVNSTTNLIDRVIVDWAEEGLYRGTLLALSHSELANVHMTMNLIRAYQKSCSSQLNTWRVYKRLVVTKHSLKYLSSIYRSGKYLPPVDYSLTEEGKQINEAKFPEANRAYNHQLFSIEIMQLHTIYEKLVYAITHFPRSGEKNTNVLDFVNQLAVDFELIGTASETDKRGYVEALNRASLKTFNSPCVTRHLFHALVNLGDYEEAQHALRTWLYLVGLESQQLVNARTTTFALASDSFGFNTPVPTVVAVTDEVIEDLAVAEKAAENESPQRSDEVELPEDKIGVLIVAVKMYCQELARGADAVVVAELAERVYNLEMLNGSSNDDHTVVGAQVYRMLGAAFGFLASQTFDQDRRPQYHKKALSSLLKSLEMDNTSWETYYQTALQHAEMRDIYGAITMITKSLQLFSSHLPSWHLLALLCTCPIKDNLGQALKTCEMAIEEAGLYYLKENNWVEYNDDIAQEVLLQMTHTLLIEKVQQSSTTESAALTAQANLFQLFGKIVVPELIPDVTSNDHLFHEAAISNGGSNNTRYGMVLSGSLGNMEQQMTPPASTSTLSGFSTSSERLTVPNANATRGRSSSNASSSIATNERARSVSSFTGRKFHLAGMFHHSSSDASSVKSVPLNNNNTKASNHHHYKLNLLGRKKSTTKKQDIAGVGVTTNGGTTTTTTTTAVGGGSLTSLLSTTSMMSGTAASTTAATLLQPGTTNNNATLTRPTTHARLQHQQGCRLLCDLWLLSAESFLKWGKLEEALKAVGEAENVDWTTHAGVWCLLGRIRLAQDLKKEAIVAFQKGLVSKPNDVECRVWLAKTYIDLGDLEVAEGILKVVTQENGWNLPSAWFYLGEIYRQTDRLDRTKDCLFYALELESTTPIQPFSILPRVV